MGGPNLDLIQREGEGDSTIGSLSSDGDWNPTSICARKQAPLPHHPWDNTPTNFYHAPFETPEEEPLGSFDGHKCLPINDLDLSYST